MKTSYRLSVCVCGCLHCCVGLAVLTPGLLLPPVDAVDDAADDENGDDTNDDEQPYSHS